MKEVRKATLTMPRVQINREAVEKLMRRQGYETIAQLSEAYAREGLGGRKTVYELVNNETNWRRETWLGLAALLGCHPLDIVDIEGPLPKAQALTHFANGRIATTAVFS